MKIFLSVINILLLVGCLLWPLTFYMSIFLFDAPGSADSKVTLLLALAIWTYPMPAFIGNGLFWWKFKQSKIKKLAIYTAISSAGYLFIVVMIIFLEMVCIGDLICH